MKTTKTIIMVMLVAAMFGQVGCATHMTYQSNKAQSQARGMQDPSVLQVIKDNPWSTAAAAVIDAAIAWGAYEGIRSINGDSGSSSDDTKANYNSAGENVTIVQGNNNNVSITTSKPIMLEQAEEPIQE